MHRINRQIRDFAFNERRIKRRSHKDFAREFQFVFGDERLSCFLSQQLKPAPQMFILLYEPT